MLSVMKETPYRMLGCLIFERGIPPQKLEAMMNDFPHLQIVAILVKCCCPDVSSRGVVLKTGTQLLDGYKVTYCVCVCVRACVRACVRVCVVCT